MTGDMITPWDSSTLRLVGRHTPSQHTPYTLSTHPINAPYDWGHDYTVGFIDAQVGSIFDIPHQDNY